MSANVALQLLGFKLFSIQSRYARSLELTLFLVAMVGIEPTTFRKAIGRASLLLHIALFLFQFRPSLVGLYLLCFGMGL